MSALDGGSAAAPTADVPACGDQLAIEPDNCTYVCSEPVGHDGAHFDAVRHLAWTRGDVHWPADRVDGNLDPPSPNAEALRVAMDWDKLPRMTPAQRRRFDEENARVQAEAEAFYANRDRSRVAGMPDGLGEFERRLLSDPVELAAYHSARAARLADHSGVAGEPEATTKEASEIAVAVSPTPTPAPTPETPGAVNVAGGVTVPDEAVGRFADAYRKSYAAHRDGDPPDRSTTATRAGLTAAAPLIAAQALRSAAEDLAAEVAERVQTDWGGLDRISGSGDAAVWLQRRADELERGGDRG